MSNNTTPAGQPPQAGQVGVAPPPPQPKPKKRWYVRWYMIVLYIIVAIIIISAIGSSAENANKVPLTVNTPQDGLTTADSSIVVEGTAVSDATVSINGEDVSCNSDGNFSKEISLTNGDNTITLEARAEGKTPNKQAVKVIRKLSLAEYKEEAKTIPYGQLEKNPDDYAGQIVHYQGKIFNIREEDGKTMAQIEVTEGDYGFWSDQIMVTYDGTTPYVENDVVNVYGTVVGKEDYKSVANYNMSAPLVKADYIED